MKEKVKIIEPAMKQTEEKAQKNVCAYCRVSTNIAHQVGSYESQQTY